MKTIKNDFNRNIRQYVAASQIVKITGESTLLIRSHSAQSFFCNTDSGGFTATLPPGVHEYYARIINTGRSGNRLTIAPNVAELLLGENSDFYLNDGESLIITFDSDEGWY